MLTRLTLVVLLASSWHAFAAPATSHTRRFSVRYHSDTEKDVLIQDLAAAGYSVVEHFDRQQVVAVVHPAHHESDETHSERLAAITGVHSAGRDHERYTTGSMMMHNDAVREHHERRLAYRSMLDQATCNDDPQAACKWKDTPAGNKSDLVPYGIKMIQADDPALDKFRSTVDTGVLICMIGGGVDPNNSEFRNSHLRGCTRDNDLETGFQCPFDWNTFDDVVATLFTGIMAAEENGEGVVGVIPGGADMYYVKVVNGTCNPQYGCGPVYGTSYVQAFQTCEDFLTAKQVEDVSLRWTMVVTMEVSGPGPNTLEQMYFDLAGKRNDMLWVNYANDGQFSPDQPLAVSYPAGYREVISVAAVDCNEQRYVLSRINTDVELSGPGVDNVHAHMTGEVEPSIKTLTVSPAHNLSLSSAKPLGGISRNYTVGDVTTASGRLVDCGYAFEPCTAAAGAVCLILRGGTPYFVKLAQCKAGGGIAGLIYNSQPADSTQGCITPVWPPAAAVPGLYNGAEDLLPSVKLSYDQGAALKALLDKNVTLDVTLSMETVVSHGVKLSSTAVATHYVAASAARVWSAYPQCGASDVRAALRAGAKPLGTFAKGKNRNSEYGFGLVQVKDAWAELKKAKCAQKKKATGRKLRA